MRQSVIELQKFYAGPMGQAVSAMAMRRLGPLWDDGLGGQEVLGLGYATPYLAGYAGRVSRLVLAMPGGQGAMVTRSRRGNITCLTEEDNLPFPPAQFDRVLVAHGLEDSPCVRELMDEIWRVLKPEGRLVLIVPGRSGLWARSEATPFGHGRPFSRKQLSKLLKTAQFEPIAWAGALYAPPWPICTRAPFLGGIERFGETVWPRFSGLVLVEALKRLYAGTASGSAQTVQTPRFVGARPVDTASSILPSPRVKSREL